MDLNEVMKNFSGNGTMAYGVDTAIKALRPGSRYEVSVSGGEYTYTKWWDPNQLPPPTKKEVDKELSFQEKLAKYYQYAYSRCSEYPDGFETTEWSPSTHPPKEPWVPSLKSRVPG